MQVSLLLLTVLLVLALTSPLSRAGTTCDSPALAGACVSGCGTAQIPAIGDFNGDGIKDVAVTDGVGISILLGNGDGALPPAPRTKPVTLCGW